MTYKTAILSCGFLAGLSVSLAVGVIAQQRTMEVSSGFAAALSGHSAAGIMRNDRADPPGERFEQGHAVSGEPHRYLSSEFRFRFDPPGEACDYAGTGLNMMEQKQSEEEREKLLELEADPADINRSMMRELASAIAHETEQPAPDSIMGPNAGAAMACP